MTNQDNLPVWARILLGLPPDDAVLPNHAELEEKVTPNQREASPAKPAAMEQSVRTFDAGQRARKWSWKTAFCPATREANS